MKKRQFLKDNSLSFHNRIKRVNFAHRKIRIERGCENRVSFDAKIVRVFASHIRLMYSGENTVEMGVKS